MSGVFWEFYLSFNSWTITSFGWENLGCRFFPFKHIGFILLLHFGLQWACLCLCCFSYMWLSFMLLDIRMLSLCLTFNILIVQVYISLELFILDSFCFLIWISISFFRVRKFSVINSSNTFCPFLFLIPIMLIMLLKCEVVPDFSFELFSILIFFFLYPFLIVTSVILSSRSYVSFCIS